MLYRDLRSERGLKILRAGVSVKTVPKRHKRLASCCGALYVGGIHRWIGIRAWAVSCPWRPRPLLFSFTFFSGWTGIVFPRSFNSSIRSCALYTYYFWACPSSSLPHASHTYTYVSIQLGALVNPWIDSDSKTPIPKVHGAVKLSLISFFKKSNKIRMMNRVGYQSLERREWGRSASCVRRRQLQGTDR